MTTMIKATIRRKRKGFPKIMYFPTEIQSEVENVLCAIGIGVTQYYLTEVQIDNITQTYPQPEGQ